jgi:methylphosphotriester-DNA--protein-cysteine methyltransferase
VLPNAAAAERAGFRPCVRCRPEAAPGTPAWNGSGATVSRGLTLINAGFLDEHRVAELADVLGMGAPHLTRLFMHHLGAPPGMLARTRRVQIAQKPLDESRMAITEIAFVSGFSSIRRFNAMFKDSYGRPPSHVKRKSRGRSRNGRRPAHGGALAGTLSRIIADNHPAGTPPALLSYAPLLRATAHSGAPRLPYRHLYEAWSRCSQTTMKISELGVKLLNPWRQFADTPVSAARFVKWESTTRMGDLSPQIMHTNFG